MLTLNRAPAKNAISRALLAEMDQHISSLLTNPTSRALLIRSSVPGTFCAGADLKERKGMSKPEVDAFLLGLRKVFTNVSRLPMPTIACLDGLAMGGGLELALTCDMRIAGPAATKLGLTETKLGIIPGAGGTSRMTRLVGPARAKELIFSAKLVDAVEASRIGFVDIVAQEGDGIAAFNKGVQLARSFAKNGKFKRRIDESREARNSGTNMVVLTTSSGFQRNIGGMVHRIRLRRMISCSVPRAELPGVVWRRTSPKAHALDAV